MEHIVSGEKSLATFGGGCFWCLDSVFRDTKGVLSVESGYMGGTVDHPTYHMVCSGRTGHAEVVRLEFDPQVISYEELLEIFFTIHDPTTLNRQGHDIGTQYRSVIFSHDKRQELSAKTIIKNLASAYPNPIVTEVVPLSVFYPAESYHQDYFSDNPDQPYCQAVVRPKLEKFRKVFPQKSLQKGV
ncbi:peptide-methionine (S)-S-oxide reductase MsrA [Leptospirillum ferrooxidans]|uniref:Peptide methionine sulfoxide reductase MsrA n=1 Tax=Leptospirillum ferrooxidans (strain C2-3) TaxID=1162668 RepID=I0ILQ8_LEPFC|nr:peptide-methionine (S)-S-oxide reductase MsrA [Leptospirillum ferrooxidans]BAM06207.1 putative methionine sulfoxide reductase A [Leptospirillum ferrooxidans C2-3]